jgi:hypothetical protein
MNLTLHDSARGAESPGSCQDRASLPNLTAVGMFLGDLLKLQALPADPGKRRSSGYRSCGRKLVR